MMRETCTMRIRCNKVRAFKIVCLSIANPPALYWNLQVHVGILSARARECQIFELCLSLKSADASDFGATF